MALLDWLSGRPRPATWVNVRSTAVRRISMTGRRAPFTLWVQFVKGGYAGYLGVPPALFWQMVTASSKGRFYNAAIKGRFQRAEGGPP